MLPLLLVEAVWAQAVAMLSLGTLWLEFRQAVAAEALILQKTMT